MAQRSNAGRFPDSAATLLAAVWMGMLVGVSFLATPVKFQAASLDLPVALEVGRVTFAAFSKVEWALALLLGLAAFVPLRSRTHMALATICIVIVAGQSFWLLPALDARVDAIIAGRPLPASIHHAFYAGLELTKAVALAGIALTALLRPRRRDGERTA